jgi:hypothetical protein
LFYLMHAEVAELADALVSEASVARHEGSTPSFRTTNKNPGRFWFFALQRSRKIQKRPGFFAVRVLLLFYQLQFLKTLKQLLREQFIPLRRQMAMVVIEGKLGKERLVAGLKCIRRFHPVAIGKT